MKDLNIGEISLPIKNQDTFLLLKLTDRKITKVSDVDTEDYKKKMIDQKKMNCLAYTQEVICLN